MNGKARCRILKEIRQKIADENDIPYVTQECTHKGDCKGTCPRCEAELKYLEQQLEKRQHMGKTVAVTAVAAGVALTATGCAAVEDIAVKLLTKPGSLIEYVVGEVEAPPEELMGATQLQVLDGEIEEQIVQLDGDVAYEYPVP